MPRPDHADPIEDLYSQGQKLWPAVDLDFEAFAAYARDRIGPEGADEVNAGDLYLTCACVLENSRALALLDEQYIATLDPALAHLDKSGASIEEVKQILRVRFLTKDGDRPARIGDYSGTGDLRTWLRVAAIRIAISLLRKGKRESFPGDDALLDMPARESTPELDFLKREYRAEFETAFRRAVRALSPRDRNLLRHQVLDRLSIDRIGALYGVHRATAARWVARARETLIDGVRSELQTRLGVRRGELESILRLIQSRLDISLSVFLSQTPRP